MKARAPKLLLSITTFVTLILLVAVGQTQAQSQLRLPRESQRASVSQTIGITDVTITYHRPRVKGRTIYGELVPYNQVWRTGANEATAITFSDDVTIDGQKLSAGRYSLHTIPTKTSWTIIFNKVAEQWGSYSYDQKQDALRVTVQPENAPKEETLKFDFMDVSENSAKCVMHWDTLRVGFNIGVEVEQKALASARAAMAALDPKDFRTPYQVAAYAFSKNLVPDEAMSWIEKSIAINSNFYNLSQKARMLAKRGDTAAAIKTAEEALVKASASKEPVDTVATQKLLAELKAKRS